jgi:hypothetical protein
MVDYKLLAQEKAMNKNQVEDGLLFDNFLAACYVKCSSQSYGPKIEKRVVNDFNFKKIPQKKGVGDFEFTEKTKFPLFDFKVGDKSELKISFLSADGSWNLIQLRPYEKFNYYIFLLIDPIDNCGYEWFILKKEDVNDLNFKLNAIHGTKESNKENKNIEYKLTVPKNGETYTKLKKLNLLKNV